LSVFSIGEWLCRENSILWNNVLRFEGHCSKEHYSDDSHFVGTASIGTAFIRIETPKPKLFGQTFPDICHQLCDSGLCIVDFRMSRKRVLDTNHGILKRIRGQLHQQADELGLTPWDNSRAATVTGSSDEASIAAATQLPPGIIIHSTRMCGSKEYSVKKF